MALSSDTTAIRTARMMIEWACDHREADRERSINNIGTRYLRFVLWDYTVSDTTAIMTAGEMS